ncbi:phosphoenolpyruvate--protein phosphotransferase [Solimonas marina]|uniref:phosphoenolpyruvate--protein phosphotransferase n=1 Tax=Solimonas marina TaxID=2714601 RepID=A0A969WAG1_9GAMM|nr:phosphoenolpyruvate--protein phosphotransferase [Solimonas marina]NKF22534.1 phosphoenolpyruvate--protein phosphotransferase [Solimonas marina]
MGEFRVTEPPQATDDETIAAPLAGVVFPLRDVPDPVFADGLVGDGCAIDPLVGELRAPCDGTVVQLARTAHALTLKTDSGSELLMHIGVETVQLQGEGFAAHVAQGARVRAGQLLIAFDLDALASRAKSLLTVVAVANGEQRDIAAREVADYLPVDSGAPLLRLSARATAAPMSGPTAAAEIVEAAAVVRQSGGLHARPAARVRQALAPFTARVQLRAGERQADARSVVALMGLGLREDDAVKVRGEGGDAAAAVAAVVAALETRIAGEVHATSSAGTMASGGGLLAPDVIGGVSAAPGIAIGTLVRWAAERFEVPQRGESPARETDKLDRAFGDVSAAIIAATVAARARQRTAEADIFDAHLALLNDPQIVAAARTRIAAGDSAAAAWQTAIDQQCQLLAELEHSLIAERVNDLRDLERRMLRALGVGSQSGPALPDAAVVLADDLTPSEFSTLDAARLKGLCLIRGGVTSHVAIIARAQGVPVLVGLGDAAATCADGATVIVDADRGRFEFAPDGERLAAVRAELASRQRRQSELQARAQEAALTRDGTRIEVAANITDRRGAQAAYAAGADAIGLLRTEILFLDRDAAPDADAQRASYEVILDAMHERPVIIRTLDVGGDKPVGYLPFPHEPNPALGLRGVRIVELHHDVFEQQLRALLALRRPQQCRIMLPMVTEVAEIIAVRERLTALAAEMGIDALPPLGAMIEVPAAALLAEQLAAHVDFLSIGTNDLTQYVLAMDRGHAGLAPRLDGLHPAVLRLIAQTVEGASRHGVWVGVCGALASDPDAVAVLVGLGVSELSVDAPSVARVKARVRELDLPACRDAVRELLALDSAAAVRRAAKAKWPA